MLNIDNFISEIVIKRSKSLFSDDINANYDTLLARIKDKKICVIGGAGSIGSSFIKAILPFQPAELIVVDLSENNLAELTRDLRSTAGLFVPSEYHTYAIDFSSPIFRKILASNGGCDVVANFSAHKHVRSEEDRYSVEALIENNILKAQKLLDLLTEFNTERFFCVSTDKAANPVNIMGASKRIMEDLIMAYSDRFNVSTARFANVVFSNGSLPDGWIHRMLKRQPLSAPSDVKRYFVSPQESGQICLLACLLGDNREIFFPKLDESSMMTFSSICDEFLNALGYKKVEFQTDDEAKAFMASQPGNSLQYAVHYSVSDTSGEKPFEEFYSEGENIDFSRFDSLGVIKQKPKPSLDDVNSFLGEIRHLFAKKELSKREIVSAIKEYLPSFNHDERGKNLNYKM